MSPENSSEKDGFWFIERKSIEEHKIPYYIVPEPKTNTEFIPLFFSEKDAGMFMEQLRLHPKKWGAKKLTLTYSMAYLILAENKTFHLKLFYSYDKKDKGWGVKDWSLNVKESYFKVR
jgi:hypothetical protein